MKDSFKYAILLLLVSFLVAILCCNSQVFESYSSYPFDKPDEELQNLDTIKNTIFKYNEYITENDSGREYHDINKFIKMIDENKIKREGIKYEKLLDSQPSFSNYMPFESKIISTDELTKFKNIIKGKEIKIDPGKKPESLLAQSLDPIVDGGLGSLNNIIERNISGDIYYEANKCIGEWSEWNTENCGNDRNRCGIKFKKHTVLSREINDKNGPGKPCDYDDGLIKYKYCKGDNADDYDSNIKRCDMPNNICPCKLNNDSSIILDGENVYELEDEDCKYQIELNCLCPKGYTHLNIKDICKLTPGVDCGVGDTGCVYNAGTDTIEEKCEIPSFINRETEDNFYKKYDQVNGKCKKKECICPNGTPVEDEYCLIDGMELCDETKKCDTGYYMSGNPPKCMKQSESGTDESVYKECNCLYGTPKIEESDNNRCNADEDETYATDPTILQYCNSTGCAEGYKHVTGLGECNDYYPSDKYSNITCCIPEYDMCILEEPDLEEKHIIRKNKDGQFMDLNNKSVPELKEVYNEIEILEEITAEELLEKKDSKLFLIEKIIEYNPEDTENLCNKNINIKDCYSNFQCSPGYAFLPSDIYSDENELRIVACDFKDSQNFRTICKPIKNCLGINVDTLSWDNDPNPDTGKFLADGEDCMFSSHLLYDEIKAICIKNDIDENFCNSFSAIVNTCYKQEENNTCSSDCVIDQINDYYPIWNGSCVPVTCPLSEEVLKIYNISNESCRSGSVDCDISNLKCKNDDYNIPSMEKLMYCPSPQKVDSDYLTNEYELINYGCALEPPEPTDPKEIRKKLKALQDASSANSQKPNVNPENIDQEVDYSGSTEEMVLDLETGLLEQRLETESQVENREGGLASFGTR
jgi:hypothetical protein